MAVSDSVLILSATADGVFRHADAIEAGLPVLGEIAGQLGYQAITTEDVSVLNEQQLESVAAVIFHQVNGTVLAPPQRAALAEFVRAGGGWMGVHNSSGAERDWPDYPRLVQARFVTHPPINAEPVGLRPHTDHPSVAHLPDPWGWSDEWYEFDRVPEATVLLSMPELSLPELSLAEQSVPESGDSDVPGDVAVTIRGPLAWTHHWGQGRTWYTALGHRPEAYTDPNFVSHLAGGLASVLPQSG